MNNTKADSLDRRAGLKRMAAGMERPCHTQQLSRTTPTGHAAIDAMTGGGIASARLHDIFAATPEDASSAAGFAAMLARQRPGPIVWIRQDRQDRIGGRLHGEGLAEIGIDPARLLLCLAADAAALLRCANEAARCRDVGTVIAEIWRGPKELTLTASRRLALSGEASGATALMLRVDADPEPSAAATRWSVSSAASLPLPGNAPGMTALDVRLLRQRGRAGEGQWRIVWDRDRACFTEYAPLSGASRPLPAFGPVAPGDARRAA